jgi:hypothetical protein
MVTPLTVTRLLCRLCWLLLRLVAHFFFRLGPVLPVPRPLSSLLASSLFSWPFWPSRRESAGRIRPRAIACINEVSQNTSEFLVYRSRKNGMRVPSNEPQSLAGTCCSTSGRNSLPKNNQVTHVGMDVESDAGRCVAKQSRHTHDVLTVRRHQRGKRMSQVVKADLTKPGPT